MWTLPVRGLCTAPDSITRLPWRKAVPTSHEPTAGASKEKPVYEASSRR